MDYNQEFLPGNIVKRRNGRASIGRVLDARDPELISPILFYIPEGYVDGILVEWETGRQALMAPNTIELVSPLFPEIATELYWAERVLNRMKGFDNPILY